MSNIYFCGECKYLNPTEREQSIKKEYHICQKYKVRLYHREFHPEILKCSACINEGSNLMQTVYTSISGI